MDWKCESCGEHGTTVDGMSLSCCPSCGKTIAWDTNSRYYKCFSTPQEELKRLLSASKSLKLTAGLISTLVLVGELTLLAAPLQIFMIGSAVCLFVMLGAVLLDFCRQNWGRIVLQVVSVLVVISGIFSFFDGSGAAGPQTVASSAAYNAGYLAGKVIFLVLGCAVFMATRKKALFAEGALTHRQLQYIVDQQSAGKEISEKMLDCYGGIRKKLFSYTMVLFYLFLSLLVVTVCVKGIRENTDADLIFRKGNAYLNGKGLEQDPAKALECFLKGAEKGHGPSQAMAASFYLRGNIVPRDLKKGFDLASRAAAKNVKSAYNLLALYYMGEFGFEVADPRQFYEWSKKEYEAGMVSGLFHQAVCFSQGFGCEKNIPKAVELYKKLISRGLVEGKIGLAALFLRGEGIPQNLENGLRLAKEAAEKGSVASYPLLASYYLGLYSEKTADPKQAFFWSDKALKAKLPTGKTYMALCLLNGYGCKADEKAGLRLLQEAVSERDPLALEIVKQFQSGK